MKWDESRYNKGVRSNLRHSDMHAEKFYPASVPGDREHDLRGVQLGDVLVLDNQNNSRTTGIATVCGIDETHVYLTGNLIAEVSTGRLEGSSHGVARLPAHQEIENDTARLLRGRLIYFDYELLSIAQMQRINALLTEFMGSRKSKLEAYQSRKSGKAEPVAESEPDVDPEDAPRRGVRCCDIFKSRGFGNPCA